MLDLVGTGEELSIDMDSAVLKIGDGVDLRGVSAEILPAFYNAPIIFFRYGFDCWLTSACRDDKKSLHGWGRSLDFDASTYISEEAGHRIAADLQVLLGLQYYCTWHKTKSGNWHLHVEFDPGNRGVSRFV